LCGQVLDDEPEQGIGVVSRVGANGLDRQS
jgi:hypothetical protein